MRQKMVNIVCDASRDIKMSLRKLYYMEKDSQFMAMSTEEMNYFLSNAFCNSNSLFLQSCLMKSFGRLWTIHLLILNVLNFKKLSTRV